MKGLLKGTVGLFAIVLLTLGISNDTFATTAIYIGKDASAEGTTVLGESVESKLGVGNVIEIVEKGTMHKGDVIEAANGFKYTLPADNVRMVLSREMTYTGTNGWNNCAVNENGVSVLSLITTDPNTDAAEADPFVEDGLSEEKIASIVAATSHSARDAVMTLCSIYEETGAQTAEIVLIADKDGAWVVENFTGHQYVATKLPDDLIATFSNDPVIKTADPDDKDTICSKELFTLPKDNDFAIYDKDKNLNLMLTYNANNQYSDECHLRGWVGHDIFAPSQELDYDDEDDYDVFFKPDEKVSITEAFKFFRNRFEGTQYDLSDDDNALYYGINNQRVSGVNVIQIFDGLDDAMSTVLWTSPANPTASPFIAIPAIVAELPASIATDVEEDAYTEDILQFELSELNNSVVTRRKAYGGSIREFWEGVESVSAKDVTEKMRADWNDEYKASPEKAASTIKEYVAKTADDVEENGDRLEDELQWFMFKNGQYKSSVPDEEIAQFDCSFDAVAYAQANGWETRIDGDLFTATKDDKTITVALSGDDEGSVTFTGFDNKKLIEDFMTDTGYTQDDPDMADGSMKDEEEIPEEAKEEKTEEIDKELNEVEEEIDEAETETKEDAKADDTKAEDAKASDETIEEVATNATKQIEVDTIAALSAYFAEKTASVPRDGWAENEIAKQLSDVSYDVTGIIGKYFNGADIEDIIGFDASKLAGDEDIAKVGDKVVAAGMDLSALVEKYFTSLYEDVSGDIVNGRLSQEGAVRILNEAEGNIEGIATLYLEGVAGAFSEVFNTDLSQEELAETLAELGDGTLDLMDEYGAIDKESLGLGDLDLKDLTDADIDVVITLNEMDEDVIDGLSSLLGVDVRSMLDQYIEMINNSNSKTKIVEEKHESDKAYSAPNKTIIAAIDEIEETSSDDDYVVPQEIIDILNEAIAEAQAQGEDGEEKSVEEIVDEIVAEMEKAETEAASADEAAAEAEKEAEEETAKDPNAFSVNVGRISSGDGKVMLPAYMLKYFN